MSKLHDILESNSSWAEKVNNENPTFFSELAKQQIPKYLWIGCSDSRIPETTITNMAPGDIFVHRNIANQVIHTDLNCLSVIKYAVEALKVEKIIVCGHYGCGGVKASMEEQDHGFIDNWLNNIKDVQISHKNKLESTNNEEDKFKLLCELNIHEQVKNLSRTTIIKNAWDSKQAITIHGLIYNLEDGKLKELDI